MHMESNRQGPTPTTTRSSTASVIHTEQGMRVKTGGMS